MGEVVNMLEALTQAQAAVNSVLDLDELFAVILDSVRQVFGLEACAILLTEPDGQTLRIRSAVGYDPDLVRGWRGRIGEGITGKVAAEGKALLVCDVANDLRYTRGVHGAICEMAAPLSFRGNVLGVLDAESARQLRQSDLDYFRLFALQAAVALRNAQLFSRAEKRSRELEQLARAGTRMNSASQAEEVLSAILDASYEALGYDRCVILENQDGFLAVRAAKGHEAGNLTGLRIPFGTGITGWAALHREAVLVPDVQTDPRYIAGSRAAVSEMAHPLFHGDRLIGVLDAESCSRAFTEDDLFLFRLFADQVGSVLYQAELLAELQTKNRLLAGQLEDIERINRELHQTGADLQRVNMNLQKRIQELSTLYEAGKTITSSLDLDETLHTILNMTERLMHISTGAIVLLDEETEEMKVRISINRKGAVTPEAGSGGGGGALPESRPALQPDPNDGHTISIPLQIGERLIGRFELRHSLGFDFSSDEESMLQTLASQAAIAIENARLYENTQRAYYQAIRSLAEALEARDAYTRGHSERVTDYALLLAADLGLNAKAQEIIRYAGLLHDIGKIGVADAVLLKSESLSTDDVAVIRHHPQFGDAILSPLGFLHEAQLIVRHHHEKWDGSGYPDGLAGDAIPLAARVIAVADSYDAMTSDRPYRAALSRQEALAEIKRGSGIQFDPDLAQRFVRLMSDRMLG